VNGSKQFQWALRGYHWELGFAVGHLELASVVLLQEPLQVLVVRLLLPKVALGDLSPQGLVEEELSGA
jgi:hypothetical protein